MLQTSIALESLENLDPLDSLVLLELLTAPLPLLKIPHRKQHFFVIQRIVHLLDNFLHGFNSVEL